MTRAQDGNGEKVGARLLALADRCEQATGPDRELDAAIECVCAPERIGIIEKPMLEYTASLDAAMTLVPQGQAVELATGAARLLDARVNWKHSGLGKTPALALCAAALKARACR